MRNCVTVPVSERPPIPAFIRGLRRYRHDGWTPERQKAFIKALADCGSVRRRSSAMVNMSNESAHVLRRAPEAGEEPMVSANMGPFALAAPRLKDIA